MYNKDSYYFYLWSR